LALRWSPGSGSSGSGGLANKNRRLAKAPMINLNEVDTNAARLSTAITIYDTITSHQKAVVAHLVEAGLIMDGTPAEHKTDITHALKAVSILPPGQHQGVEDHQGSQHKRQARRGAAFLQDQAGDVHHGSHRGRHRQGLDIEGMEEVEIEGRPTPTRAPSTEDGDGGRNTEDGPAKETKLSANISSPNLGTSRASSRASTKSNGPASGSTMAAA
jgi:hypothetical protein